MPLSRKKLRRRLRRLEARVAELEACRPSWTDVPPDPLAGYGMDPDVGLAAECAPVAPAPSYVDPDEWSRGGTYL